MERSPNSNQSKNAKYKIKKTGTKKWRKCFIRGAFVSIFYSYSIYYPFLSFEFIEMQRYTFWWKKTSVFEIIFLINNKLKCF